MALEVSDEEIDRFVDFLTGYTRRELLESYQNGDNMIVLATAAPDIYAIRFANKLGINYVCATTKDGQENKGVVKLEGVQKLLADENLILSAVITDHEDDLPLLQFNRHVRIYLYIRSNQRLKNWMKTVLNIHCFSESSSQRSSLMSRRSLSWL